MAKHRIEEAAENYADDIATTEERGWMDRSDIYAIAKDAHLAGAEFGYKELTWNDARKTKPPIDTEVVCKMRGVPHAKHFICKWDGAYWWFWNYFNKNIIGWIGLNEDWEVVKWKEI